MNITWTIDLGQMMSMAVFVITAISIIATLRVEVKHRVLDDGRIVEEAGNVLPV